MLYARLDKDNQLETINISYLYDELKETIENYNNILYTNAVIEVGMDRAGQIFIYLESNDKYLQYNITCNEYYVELFNNLTDEVISVAFAPHDEKDIAQIFISEVCRVAEV